MVEIRDLEDIEGSRETYEKRTWMNCRKMK